MINKDAKLNPHIFDSDVQKEPIRNGYGKGLVLAGEKNENVVVLTADLTESTRCEEFAQRFPERFFQVGVAEQNLATIAAGLGITGKIPFISSYAVFSPGRNWEQIRTTIIYNDSNVKIAGHHAGIATGPDGVTHQATEDIAMMRALPNTKIFVPCDAIEARKAVLAVAQMWGPAYLRFSRPKAPLITTEETPYLPGKAEVFWQSKKPEVLIIACGHLVYQSLLAAKELDQEGVGSVVLNNHTLKPLDYKTIAELAKKCRAVVTVEDHQTIGGLAGAVAEALVNYAPTPAEFIGLQNVFAESGEPDNLIEKYGLGVNSIKAAVEKVIKRKK